MTERPFQNAPVPFPVSVSNGAYKEPMKGTKWDWFLEELQALPADAPEWEGIRAFMETLQQLAEAKRHQQEGRIRLQQALTALVTQCSNMLSFFGLSDEVTAWNNTACALTQAATLGEQVEHFRTLLISYSELHQHPMAATLAEELPRRKKQLALENHITQLSSALSQAFKMDVSQPPPPSLPQTARAEEGESIEEATPIETAPAGLDTLLPPSTSAQPGHYRAPEKDLSPLPAIGGDPDSSHAPLDGAARHYSPLTRAQERQLNAIQAGVGFIFASEALGFSNLVEACKRFIPADLPEGVKASCIEIPLKLTSSTTIKKWLEQHARDHTPEEQPIVYRILSTGTKEQFREQVRAALDVSKQPTHNQRPGLRVLFLLDARATWTWFSLPYHNREIWEDQAAVVTFPRRWDLSSIRHRLAQHGKINAEEVGTQVLSATGGWPYLLDVLFYRCGMQEDPRPFAQAMEREFKAHSTKLVQQFRYCVGLGNNDSAQQVLEFVHRQKQVPADLGTSNGMRVDLPLPSIGYTTAVEYLRRMGCVDVQDGMLSVEPVVGRLFAQPQAR